MADVVELFNKLESNQGGVVEEVKKTIHEIFNSSKYFKIYSIQLLI